MLNDRPTGLTADEQILEEARRRFKMCVEAEREIRQEATKDLEFLAGDQWNAKKKRERESAGRPALVFNKLPTYVQHVSNQARQNKPAIKVHPVDSAADPDTAKVNQGIIRHIEYDSNADTAYDTALQYAASCGFGFFRFMTEYADDDTFDQVIKCVRVDDPMTIYLDVDSHEPDGSDANYGFVIDRMTRDGFEAEHGDIEPMGDTLENELSNEGWIEGESVRVAEYWRVEIKKRKLRMVNSPDGIPRKVYTDDEDYDAEADFVLDKDGKPRERETNQRKIVQYLLNGARIIETNPWPGQWIPIPRVLGQELFVSGKRKLFSLIRFVRDPQQLLNYYKSIEAESISLAPRPKWVGFLGQFKTKARDWARANITNVAVLEADPVMSNGALAPLPRWETFEPPVQALSVGAAQCIDDIKSGTGIFDPSLGSQARETSGIAIQRRKQESDLSNFHFIDNLGRAQRFAGRILLDLIPKIYDTAREIRIVGDDEKQRVVKVNTPWVDEKGKEQHYKLDVGRYDVTVTTGPSYSTQREEAFDLLTQMAQGDPEIMQVGGDIIFRNSDIPGGDELSERWKRKIALTMPGVIQEDSNMKDVPVEIQTKLAQSQAMIQQLQQQLQQAMQTIQTKGVENQSKERVAEIQAATAKEVAEIKAGYDHALVQLKADMAEAQAAMQAARDADAGMIDRAHQRIMQQRDQDHQASQQQAEQQAQQGQQQADQAHEAGMAGMDQAHQADMQQADQAHTADLQQADQAHQVDQTRATQHHQAGLQKNQLTAAQKLAAMKPKPAPKPAAKK